jgi:cob(I)alamin adenosyltransferase
VDRGAIGKGYIQIYTGNGKGKTTAALGLALRAAGHGLKSIIIQFMKGWIDYGELEGVKMLAPYVELHQFGRDTFVNPENPDRVDLEYAMKGFMLAEEVVRTKQGDIIILDELVCTVSFNLILEENVLALMDSKPDGMELIMTGRGATEMMIAKADLVTEMKDIKHYYADGVDARIGIER